MASFENHQSFKSHFLNELRVSFKDIFERKLERRIDVFLFETI